MTACFKFRGMFDVAENNEKNPEAKKPTLSQLFVAYSCPRHLLKLLSLPGFPNTCQAIFNKLHAWLEHQQLRIKFNPDLKRVFTWFN